MEAKYLSPIYSKFDIFIILYKANMYYTVEDILDKKIVYGKIWYKVKWLGYSE